MRLVSFVSLAAGACAAFPQPPSTDRDAPLQDAALIDATPPCDPMKPFGPPTNLGAINSAGFDFGARLSADQLTIFFANDNHLVAATRPTVEASFGAPIPLDSLTSSAGAERDPSITADGLTIYFASTRITGSLSNDLFVATRPTSAADFGTPALVAGINGASSDLGVNVTPDGNTLYFNSDRTGKGLVHRAIRAAGGTFKTPVAIAELGDAFEPAITADELTIYFARDDANGKSDMFVSRRSTSTDGFGLPEPVNELNTSARERPSWVSPDGCTLFFDSDRAGGAGGFDVYVATRPL